MAKRKSMTKKQKEQIKELEEKIIRLTHLWYEYVSRGYYKDSDCH